MGVQVPPRTLSIPRISAGQRLGGFFVEHRSALSENATLDAVLIEVETTNQARTVAGKLTPRSIKFDPAGLHPGYRRISVNGGTRLNCVVMVTATVTRDVTQSKLDELSEALAEELASELNFS